MSPEELRRLPYPEYLRTAHWKEVRARKLASTDRRCQLCNGQESLNVHHRTYERLGEELLKDLTVLCHPCHKRHHRYIKTDRRRFSLLKKGIRI